MTNSGHDRGELKQDFMPGLSYVQCSRCGRRGFSVWNEATAENWFNKHAKECQPRETSNTVDEQGVL